MNLESNIFIAWSKEQSKAVATAMHGWIKKCVQSAEPFLSETDIEKGAKWSSEIRKQLDTCKFGIICLTPENLSEPWIHFEAGAISKTIQGESFVATYLFKVAKKDVEQPLAQFQATQATQEDTKKLVLTINRALNQGSVPDDIIASVFDRLWPDLEELLNKIPSTASKPPTRKSEDLIEEILEITRQNSREMQLIKDYIAQQQWKESLVQEVLAMRKANQQEQMSLYDFFKETKTPPTTQEQVMKWIKSVQSQLKELEKKKNKKK